MHDIVTIGSALIDIFITAQSFSLEHRDEGVYICQKYGDKVDVDSFGIKTGGGAGNTAVGFARLGFSSAVVTELGKDVLSTVVMDEFHREFVSTNFVVQEKKEETGGSVILVGSDGGRTVLVHRGASSMLDPQDIPLRALKRARWVHLSSIGGRSATLSMIAEGLAIGKTELSWNPGQGEIKLLLNGTIRIRQLPCKILFLNATEWQLLAPLHQEIRTHVPEIIVTNGGKGGIVYTKAEPQGVAYAPARKPVVDETGAGDAFAVGYVAARLRSKTLETACSWAVRNATSVIQKYGAKEGLLTETQLADEHDSEILLTAQSEK